MQSDEAVRVDLIDEGRAVGAGLEFEDERAHMVVDIGAHYNVAIMLLVHRSSLSLSEPAIQWTIRFVTLFEANTPLQIGERLGTVKTTRTPQS